jgi:hypothetical protein
MSYNPADFIVGIMDFFSVLLPGALLTFLARDYALANVFGRMIPALHSPVESWAAFALSSYLLGQFVFLVSATFMDHLYDKTYLRYKRRKGDKLFAKARGIQGDAKELAGTLKWANSFVRLRSAEAGRELDRLEATSKFFRSVALVIGLFIVALAAKGESVPALVCVALALLSFWRFSDQRWKFCELTYLYFVQMNDASFVKDAARVATATKE